MNQEKFKKVKKKKAVFFDRDGVLNFDTGYVHKIQSFKWIDGAKRTIKYLNELDYLVIVITNQSGVSRGYFNEEDLRKLHNWMNDELKKENARIDDFFYCTDLPNNNVKSRRKPSPAMINEAFNKHFISKKGSFLIGDKESDIISAKKARIEGFLFEGGDLFDMIQKILKKNLI